MNLSTFYADVIFVLQTIDILIYQTRNEGKGQTKVPFRPASFFRVCAFGEDNVHPSAIWSANSEYI